MVAGAIENKALILQQVPHRNDAGGAPDHISSGDQRSGRSVNIAATPARSSRSASARRLTV